jgi:hypothetical protein
MHASRLMRGIEIKRADAELVRRSRGERYA